jgi:DNA polymerase II large subunit
MSENAAISRIKGVQMPDYYLDYYSQISEKAYQTFEKAAAAKSTLADCSGNVEPKIAFDLADRVAKMHDIDIAEPLRDLLKIKGKELAALDLSKSIALGQYLPPETLLEQRLDHAVRVGLAIVTEGVTIAPLQGISAVTIKKNRDGSEYLSVSIAGPMRSAGGTESAVTMLIADHVRKAVGLGKYEANAFDDETGRFVEELRVYERDVGNFQYHVLDEDVVTVISNLPVELDGVDTDPNEVVNHKNMARIKTDRVRGGALRVLNDGIIGRAKKLLKRIELYGLDGWEWLSELKGGIQKGDEEDSAARRLKEVIAGRSVLSLPNKIGGFRLRYGRSCNTGFAAVGIHPVVAEILNHTIAVGTQVKIDVPGKGATIAFVDSIETPTVRLKNGNVVKIQNVEHGIKIKDQIEKILYLGDILISFGDFLENNAQLIPTGFVEEFWIEELKSKILKYEPSSQELQQFLIRTPNFEEALELSLNFQIPLHPKYLFYWEQISVVELGQLLQPTKIQDDTISYPINCKKILENLGVPHEVINNELILQETEAQIFYQLLFANQIKLDDADTVPQIITKSSAITIRPKFSTSIGVRIGRPEKAAPRLMKPPVHALFPVGDKGGSTRDLLKASSSPNFYCNIYNRVCKNCSQPSISINCQKCGNKTTIEFVCPVCRASLEQPFCQKCKKKVPTHSFKPFPLKEKILAIQEKTGIRVQEPFKGVMELISQDRIAEPLEKGLIRQSLDLTVFKDGTIRFDATNSPLTHFKPAWIGTTIERLCELGYTEDIDGKPLTNPDQIVEIKMQDVVIPYESGRYLVNVCKYIDTELEKLYGNTPFYNVKNTDELIGQLVIGLAPHTSVGIVGRIIGYTDTHVCFATPNWHSAKRRDADGDADSIMLLMDALLNFSRQFLSDKIGGLMDAPLLVQPTVLPHESQPQAHNLEVTKILPLEFFEDTLLGKKASEVTSVEIIKSRLETEAQFYGYYFTHITTTLTTSRSRSAYSTLGSMLDKFDMQIRTAELINAVDTNEIVTNVITTHLVPDIIGNLRAYGKQKFRCTACGRKYRRTPLLKHCICGNDLIQTITRPSIEKYLRLAKRLVEKYEVGPYVKGRIATLADEIDLVFGKRKGDQLLLTDYQ